LASRSCLRNVWKWDK